MACLLCTLGDYSLGTVISPITSPRSNSLRKSISNPYNSYLSSCFLVVVIDLLTAAGYSFTYLLFDNELSLYYEGFLEITLRDIILLPFKLVCEELSISGFMTLLLLLLFLILLQLSLPFFSTPGWSLAGVVVLKPTSELSRVSDSPVTGLILVFYNLIGPFLGSPLLLVVESSPEGLIKLILSFLREKDGGS